MVCLLACRCFMSRSIKNASNNPARLEDVFMAVVLPNTLKPYCCQLQKLWYGRQIPVRVRKPNMTEEGTQDVNASLDIHAFSIPVDQRTDGKPMAKIMHSWATALGGTSQANLAGDSYEGAEYRTISQPATAFRNEKASTL